MRVQDTCAHLETDSVQWEFIYGDRLGDKTAYCLFERGLIIGKGFLNCGSVLKLQCSSLFCPI